MRNALALVLCLALAAPGCASTGLRFSASDVRSGQPANSGQVADRAAVADFARQLPVGSRVRVRVDHHTVRGTLVKVTDRAMVIQPRTRIMEPPIDVALDRISAVEIEQPNNVGKAIAIGVATGAATALGVFLVILAIAIND